MATCENCGRHCDPAELRELAGKQVCEDCFLDGVELTRGCDPRAVHSAKKTLPPRDCRN